jgi:hypothetical protein
MPPVSVGPGLLQVQPHTPFGVPNMPRDHFHTEKLPSAERLSALEAVASHEAQHTIYSKKIQFSSGFV